ncbi:hypothetical protein HAX54_038509, partial [Datura stramonium]|nr:hypothetical protein [Datura stramonium]
PKPPLSIAQNPSSILPLAEYSNDEEGTQLENPSSPPIVLEILAHTQGESPPPNSTPISSNSPILEQLKRAHPHKYIAKKLPVTSTPHTRSTIKAYLASAAAASKHYHKAKGKCSLRDEEDLVPEEPIVVYEYSKEYLKVLKRHMLVSSVEDASDMVDFVAKMEATGLV